MEIVKILEIVERESRKPQLKVLLGEHFSILDTLLEEGSLFLEKGQYLLNKDAFTESMLCFLLGGNIRKLDSCHSTNVIAMDLLGQGWEGIVITDQQTEGKGRQGRTWVSESGKNLLFSVARELPIPIAEVSKIPLLWSAQIAEALDLYVKWPNDIIDSQDRKVGGILSSVHSSSSSSTKVVIGIGLNINQESFPADIPNASSLKLIKGSRFSRTEVLKSVLLALENSWKDDLSLWRKRNRTLGRRVKIGEKSGIATGLRDDGALLLDGYPILMGDVELIEHGRSS